MKVLVFDIYGDLAHFRKFYTTSSPLTFPFPPPSTIKGMLGAIIGVDKKITFGSSLATIVKLAFRS